MTGPGQRYSEGTAEGWHRQGVDNDSVQQQEPVSTRSEDNAKQQLGRPGAAGR